MKKTELNERQIEIIYQALFTARNDVKGTNYAGSDIQASEQVIIELDRLIDLFKKSILASI